MKRRRCETEWCDGVVQVVVLEKGKRRGEERKVVVNGSGKVNVEG